MKRLYLPPTLETALRDYIIARRVKPDTAEQYRQRLNRYVPELMRKRLNEIAQEEATAKYEELSRTIPSMATFVFKTIRAIYNFSMHYYSDKDGQPFQIRNPTLILTARREWALGVSSGVSTGIDPKTVGFVYGAFQLVNSDIACDLLRFCLLTGIPCSEARRLSWKDIDVAERLVMIHECQGDDHQRCRRIPLAEPVCLLLHQRSRSSNESYIFPSRDGQPLSINNVNSALRRLRERHGVAITPTEIKDVALALAADPNIRPVSANSSGLEKAIRHLQRTEPERLRDMYDRIAEFIIGKASSARKDMPEGKPRRAPKPPSSPLHQPSIASPF